MSSEHRGRTRPRAEPAAPRDMEESSIGRILRALLGRVPGAVGAVLVDFEGETVDYAGPFDPFDLKIAAAEWHIVTRNIALSLARTQRSETLSARGTSLALRWVVVRSLHRSFIVRALPDEYVLVMLLRRRAGFVSAPRAFSVFERELALEASWPVPTEATWYVVNLELDARGRPRRIRAGDVAWDVTVLGAVTGLSRQERGYRVRLETGRELTVVRESSRVWFTEERLVSQDAPERDNARNSAKIAVAWEPPPA